ncbi:MAG: hypothetical protein ABIQ18_07335 [Umezawaea sp.]
MDNRVKTALVAALMGVGLVMSAAPASAVGRFDVYFYDGSGAFVMQMTEQCPAAGARKVWGILPSNARVVTRYKVLTGGCKMTAFTGQNGTGTGVGLQRDGGNYGLGAVTRNAHSLVTYGS